MANIDQYRYRVDYLKEAHWIIWAWRKECPIHMTAELAIRLMNGAEHPVLTSSRYQMTAERREECIREAMRLIRDIYLTEKRTIDEILEALNKRRRASKSKLSPDCPIGKSTGQSRPEQSGGGMADHTTPEIGSIPIG